MIGDRHRDRDVDADHADVDALREFARRVAVAGEDRDTVAVLVLRRQFECGFEIRGADDLEYRDENLFLVTFPVGGDLVEERRADEAALLMPLECNATTVGAELGDRTSAG